MNPTTSFWFQRSWMLIRLHSKSKYFLAAKRRWRKVTEKTPLSYHYHQIILSPKQLTGKMSLSYHPLQTVCCTVLCAFLCENVSVENCSHIICTKVWQRRCPETIKNVLDKFKFSPDHQNMVEQSVIVALPKRIKLLVSLQGKRTACFWNNFSICPGCLSSMQNILGLFMIYYYIYY